MTATDSIISLKGSVEIVSDFFFAAINSILYQRGKDMSRDGVFVCLFFVHLVQ